MLNYLRTGHVFLPDDLVWCNELLEEADFFQLEGLAHQIHEKIEHLSGAATAITVNPEPSLVPQFIPSNNFSLSPERLVVDMDFTIPNPPMARVFSLTEDF